MKKYIPKIHFIYTWAFDNFQRANFEKNGIEYPSVDKVSDGVVHIRKLWDEVNKDDKVIKGIVDILGITREYDFEFFIYGKGRLGAISTPLMLGLYPKEGECYPDAELLEVIVHELLHRFIQSPRWEKHPQKEYWDYIKKEAYPDLLLATQNHILLYAVLEKLRPLIFTPEQIDQINISLAQPLKPGYIEAINMVKEKGADFFIKEFTDRIIRYEDD